MVRLLNFLSGFLIGYIIVAYIKLRQKVKRIAVELQQERSNTKRMAQVILERQEIMNIAIKNILVNYDNPQADIDVQLEENEEVLYHRLSDLLIENTDLLLAGSRLGVNAEIIDIDSVFAPKTEHKQD